MSPADQLAAWLAARPDVEIAVLGSHGHEHLNLLPWGQPARWLDADEHPEVVRTYRALNHRAFPKLPLADWVLSDVYLVPTAIVMLRGSPARVDPDHASIAGEPAILAAWVGIPALEPGMRVGVSLLSSCRGAAAWVKLVGVGVHGATRVRGVTQWSSPSIRTHTRLGPLRIDGPVPGSHAFGDDSFVYSCALHEDVMSRALAREAFVARERLDPHDPAAVRDLMARIRGGERIHIVPPGIDAEGRVLLG